jgi:hypothetical protein
MTEGPLDLTVPLNIAAVRAALSTTGPRIGARPVTSAADTASLAPARPHEPARAGSRHGGQRRLGRIAAFVAVAAALSIGTAGALVLSNNSSNPSVSLPASGAIPVAPSSGTAQSGEHSMGSTSAHAAPSPSRSARDVDPVDLDRTADRSATNAPTGAASGATVSSSSATAAASGTGGTDFPAPPQAPINSAAGWQPLYQGQSETTQQAQETTDVQLLLHTIGYLQPWRHRSYVLPDYSPYDAGPDASGFYGSATSDAIATFQENYSVGYTGQLGECDLQTYEALMEIYVSMGANQTNQSKPTAASNSSSASNPAAQ